MKFQPTAHYGGQIIEPCCELTTSGSALTSYENINGVIWQVNLYTSSIERGGATGSDEQYQMFVTGSTSRGIVACVGGGGSAYSTIGGGYGGGGGGVILSSSITLKEDTTYEITIGQGGDGFTCPSPGTACDPNGADGNNSVFSGGGYNIIAGGGNGSTLADGSGGSSGFPNIQSSSFAGGCGASTASTGSVGGLGLSIYVNDLQFRAGGGGTNNLASSNDENEKFGGNSESTIGKRFGGGSRGILNYDSPSNTYYSDPALSGCVLVAVPMNLCTSSLYQKTNYVKNDLLQYWDFNNPRTFGKVPYDTFFKDIQSAQQLATNNTGSLTEPTAVSSSQHMQQQNWLLPSFPIQYSNTTPTSLISYDAQRISGSLSIQNTEFSIEWFGIPTGPTSETLFEIGDSTKNAPLSNPKIILTQTGGGRIDYVPHTGPEVNLFGTVTTGVDNHVVLTYDGTDLRMYVNGSLTDTESAAVSSSLSNPVLFLGDAPTPNGDTNDHKLFRAYNVELTSTEVMQNYSASAGL